jgi:hypothetical protein
MEKLKSDIEQPRNDFAKANIKPHNEDAACHSQHASQGASTNRHSKIAICSVKRLCVEGSATTLKKVVLSSEGRQAHL